jgi:hypothetical protein
MSFEVTPAALRRAGAELDTLADTLRTDLTTAYHAVAPDRSVNPGWVAGPAGDAAVASATGVLGTLAGRARGLGDSLRAAASAYEGADDRAVRRFGW